MRYFIVVLAACGLLLAACEPASGPGPVSDNTDPVSNLNLTVSERTASSAVARGRGTRAVTTEFYIGLSRQDVFDTLGDPDWIFYGNDQVFTPGVDYDADAYHVYRDKGLSFRIFGPEVREITLLNDRWIASNGLIVGMSRTQMLEILGDGYRLFESEVKDFYEYEEFDISVEVYHHDDAVGEININEGNVG